MGAYRPAAAFDHGSDGRPAYLAAAVSRSFKLFSVMCCSLAVTRSHRRLVVEDEADRMRFKFRPRGNEYMVEGRRRWTGSAGRIVAQFLRGNADNHRDAHCAGNPAAMNDRSSDAHAARKAALAFFGGSLTLLAFEPGRRARALVIAALASSGRPSRW